MKCPYCASTKIKIGIAWGKTAETGNVGLKYNSGLAFLYITGVVQVYSDLCLDCKSVLCTYKEDSNKNWNHNTGSLGSI